VELLAESVISTVNLAEVQTKLVRRGGSAEQAWMDALGPAETVVPFTADQARIAGDLVTSTRAMGLSLGDRACLALAITLKAPVVRWIAFGET
jgi:PIN domain nuclease of toxin-antitoxin system